MNEVQLGDCLDVMRSMPAESVTAIATDPPYGLEFMGKEWDHGVPGVPFWSEALRVLRPGGHALVFGGTRTFHRLACALEDAGFEIRDCLMWLYGQGFPKSLDVSKAIDKAAGAERDVIGPGRWNHVKGSNKKQADCLIRPGGKHDETAPATDAARLWSGYGTALKPAWEPIILARKPLVGTVARNCQEHGTGALNIDGCRILGPKPATTRGAGGQHGRYNALPAQGRIEDDGAGRWPANVILDEEVAAMLDEQSGELTSGKLTAENQRNGGFRGTRGIYGTAERGGELEFAANVGGASRFFYCAKASDRDVLPAEDLPLFGEKHDAERNHHPTVKPVELMRWLVRLVKGPGENLILDPFAGSGSTGVACQLEGVPFVLIERESGYVEIIKKRLSSPKQASLLP